MPRPSAQSREQTTVVLRFDLARTGSLRMSMIARDAVLLMHEHHHGGSAIPANQIDGKIRTTGSFRAMYRA